MDLNATENRRVKAIKRLKKKRKQNFTMRQAIRSDEEFRCSEWLATSIQIEDEDLSLPRPNVMFQEPLWKYHTFQSQKMGLNAVKNRLSNYDLEKWQSHTNQMDIGRDVLKRIRNEVEPEMLTHAWTKFYGLMNLCSVVPVTHIMNDKKAFKSVHLCEAPGAFITSLNHWLKSNHSDIQWDWVATTLNPYYEGNKPLIMIDDDRFIRHTLSHWCFGEDNTGDIMRLKNLQNLIEFAQPQDKIYLVTADGSVNCVNRPGEQENTVAHLIYCEMVAALHLLATGGNFVLKIFTSFECQTVCLLYLLSNIFETVNITKPATSKEGNSERYVVCNNFHGQSMVAPYMDILLQNYETWTTNAMFPKETIDRTFYTVLSCCNRQFVHQQCKNIERNISMFGKKFDYHQPHSLRRLQRCAAERYMELHKLRKLMSGEIVGKETLEGTVNYNACSSILRRSYNERCKVKALPPLEILTQVLNDWGEVETRIPKSKAVTDVHSNLFV